MSMTREEEILSYLEDINPKEIASHIEQGTLDQWTKAWKAAAARIVISALRPVSREQVEKVWRGCEKCNGAGEYSRYAENLTKTLLAKYCPHCGRPLTDEAVEMVMERLEVMKDGNSVKR